MFTTHLARHAVPEPHTTLTSLGSLFHTAKAIHIEDGTFSWEDDARPTLSEYVPYFCAVCEANTETVCLTANSKVVHVKTGHTNRASHPSLTETVEPKGTTE